MNEHERAARIAELRAQIETMRAELIRLARETAADVAGLTGEERLQFIQQQSTLSTDQMEAPIARTLSKSAKTSAAMTRSKAPFSLALMLAGKSIPEWVEEENERAKRLKTERLSVEVARAWVKKPGSGGRPIRPYWAARVEESLGITARAINWPNGIQE